jgi:hypothetical protein
LEIAKRLGDVKLSAVLIDIETLSTQTDPPYEIDQLHQALHDAINEAFGDDCELIWYGNLIHPAACETGWALDDWSPSHKWGTYSCELYYPTMLPLAREMVRRNMKSHIVGQPLYNEIVPWVSLGCGRDYDKDGNLTQWNKNWDYPVRYDALLGSELYNGPWNDPVRFAPYDKVKKVVLYPGPDLGGNCANFWPHFSAFVRGASGEKI